MLTKWVRIFRKLVYTDDVIIILRHDRDVPNLSPAAFVPVTEDNVNDALYFQPEKKIKLFREFLKKGDKGYYGYIDGKCVHRTWVVANPRPVDVHRFVKYTMRPNDIFVHYVETAESQRGKNIFASVLSLIVREWPGKNILTSVEGTNLASLKSMHKAGFKEICRLRVNIVLGIKRVEVDPLTFRL